MTCFHQQQLSDAVQTTSHISERFLHFIHQSAKFHYHNNNNNNNTAVLYSALKSCRGYKGAGGFRL